MRLTHDVPPRLIPLMITTPDVGRMHAVTFPTREHTIEDRVERIIDGSSCAEHAQWDDPHGLRAEQRRTQFLPHVIPAHDPKRCRNSRIRERHPHGAT